MAMMTYMIIVDHQVSSSHQHNASSEDVEHHHSGMFLERQLLPGLSIMNLLSFLFCVPVQVNTQATLLTAACTFTGKWRVLYL